MLTGESGELTVYIEPAGDVTAWAEPTPLGRSLGLTSGLGFRSGIKPLLAATDARPDETLARYSNGAPPSRCGRRPRARASSLECPA